MTRAALLVLVAGCYSPSLHDDQYACPDRICPAGQVCGRCGLCVAPTDAGTSDACPGCAAGARSAGDQALANLAFCPAAWLVPGVSSSTAESFATPCHRSPGADGKSADGSSDCSVEDNCAAGWHVCAGDSEARAKGMSSSRCDSDDNQHAFWVSRQPVTVDAVKGPSCTAIGAAGLIGCGALQLDTTPVSCTVLTRFLGNGASGTCATSSSNVWQCGDTSGMEAVLVVKTSAASRGGVLCCRD